jgi:uncharacterized membrane protein
MTRNVAEEARQEQEAFALRHIEILIARVLFWGSLVSVGVALTGLILYLSVADVRKIDLVKEFSQQRASAEVFTSVGAILRAAWSMNPSGIIGIGLLFLLATPILSIILTIITFLWVQDHRYAMISTVVLFVLILSIIIGA